MNMKMHVKALIALVILGALVFSVRAVPQTNPDDKINAETYRLLREKKVKGCLNQALLRECASAFSELTGIKIFLTAEVNSLPGIAVDVNDDAGVKKPMGEVLDSIISFVNKEYKLNLEWKVIDGIVVIKKVNGSAVLSDNSEPAS